MDLVKTKCKQKLTLQKILIQIYRRLATTHTNNISNKHEIDENLKYCQCLLLKGKLRQKELNILGKMFIIILGVDSAKFGNEVQFMSFAGIIAFANGTEGSNLHI
jgi:hypothetical protein